MSACLPIPGCPPPTLDVEIQHNWEWVYMNLCMLLCPHWWIKPLDNIHFAFPEILSGERVKIKFIEMFKVINKGHW